MKLFLMLLILTSTLSYGNTLKVDPKSSIVDWHLYIDKGTNVYGEIPVIEGSLDTQAQTGQIIFDLKSTRSWELDRDKKEYSDARDSRIRSITSSEKNNPVFNLKTFKEVEKNDDEVKYDISGDLSLNGKTKPIKLLAIMKGNKLSAEYQLKWKNFDITNPVIWILRATSTPNDFITVKFELALN